METILKNKNAIFPSIETVQDIKMKLQLVGSEHIIPQHIFATLDNEGERLNEEDEGLGHSVHEDYAAVNPELLQNINEEEDENTENGEQRYKSIELYDEEEMLKLL